MGLFPTGGDDFGTAAQAAQGGGGVQAQFVELADQQVAQFVFLEVAPEIFHRIEFGRIGREAFDHQPARRGRHEVPNQGAAVNRCSIPDDQQRARQVPEQHFQKRHHLGRTDAAGVHPKEEPLPTQARDEGESLPTESFLEHGRLAFSAPGPHPVRAGAQAAFINEDNGPGLPPGFFFKAGQRWRCQRRISGSCRSSARREGC